MTRRLARVAVWLVALATVGPGSGCRGRSDEASVGDHAEPAAQAAPVAPVDPALLRELLGEAVEVDGEDVRVDGLLLRLAFEPVIREQGPASVQLVQGQGYRLSGVVDGSPLWLLGLRDGDVLVEVDGQPILGREHALRSAWQGRPRRVEIDYLRDGATKRLRLRVDRSPAWRSSAPDPDLAGDLAERRRSQELLGAPAGGSSELLAEFTAGLRCVATEDQGQGQDIGRCEITRATVDALMASPEVLVRQARLVPAMRDGQNVGFKLYAIRRGTMLALLGLQNGDQLVAAGGQPLTSPEAALAAYEALRERESFTLEVERRGQRMQLELAVVEALSGPPASFDMASPADRAVSPDLKDPFARE